MKKILLLLILVLTVPVFAQKSNETVKKGINALTSRKYEEALSLFSDAIEEDSTSFLAYYNRGLAFLYMNEIQSSIDDFSKSIELNPNLADAYNNRGLAVSYTGEIDSSLADFNKALELDPKFGEAYINRASLYLNIKNYELAEKDFTSAVNLTPKNPELYIQRARLYYLLNQLDASIKDYSKAISLGIKDGKTYYNRANAYFKSQKYDLAAADYSKAIKENPNDYEAINNRAIAYDKSGKKELAEKDRAAIKAYMEKIRPSLDNIKYVKVTDSTNSIEMEVPEGWFAYNILDETISNLRVSKDKLNEPAEQFVTGVNCGVVLKMPEGYDGKIDEDMLGFWLGSQQAAEKEYLHYQIITKKNAKLDGKESVLTIARLQVDESSTAMGIYEFGTARNGKLFYAYFHTLDADFEYFKPVFDKILKSIKWVN